MAVGSRNDPYMAFSYLVEIDGLIVGGFSEVSGLQAEIEVQDYREGGVNDYIHKFAGATNYRTNLTLKRGIVADQTLYNWFFAVTQHVIVPSSGSIVLQDLQGDEVRRWVFIEAYPVKWTGPSLNATSNTVAVEAIELVHCGLYEM